MIYFTTRKVALMFNPSFYVGSRIENIRIRIRDGKKFGSGIKHPGSATLVQPHREWLGPSPIVKVKKEQTKI
jgi:hypothetical protein